MKIPILLLLISVLGCAGPSDNTRLTNDSTCFASERYGIERINQEIDTKHIRIWYGHSFLDRIPVVSIRQLNTGKWSGELFLIIWSYDTIPPRVIEVRRKELSPRTSWEALDKKLDYLQISSLPDMLQIPHLEDGWFDGSSYTVELEDGASCRKYSYHLPDKFQNEFWQARNMVQILDEIKNELGIPWAMRDSIEVAEFWVMAGDTSLKVIR